MGRKDWHDRAAGKLIRYTACFFSVDIKLPRHIVASNNVNQVRNAHCQDSPVEHSSLGGEERLDFSRRNRRSCVFRPHRKARGCGVLPAVLLNLSQVEVRRGAGRVRRRGFLPLLHVQERGSQHQHDQDVVEELCQEPPCLNQLCACLSEGVFSIWSYLGEVMSKAPYAGRGMMQPIAIASFRTSVQLHSFTSS